MQFDEKKMALKKAFEAIADNAGVLMGTSSYLEDDTAYHAVIPAPIDHLVSIMPSRKVGKPISAVSTALAFCQCTPEVQEEILNALLEGGRTDHE